ncbi:MAG: Kelch repeat-containing protein [Candidatus Micrarchaeaceae archaeon]
MQDILTKRFRVILLLFGVVGLAIAMIYLPPRYSLSYLHALNNSTGGILNYIYCVGDSGHGGQNLTYYAPILASHSIGTWKQTTSYPVGVDDVGCDIYGSYIYCVGTNATLRENQTYYARISSSGIGNWTETTPYPVRFTYGSCSAYRGYIYCVGDWAIPSNQSYYAALSDSGIGNWIKTTSYPTPFYWAGCSINRGYIYCVGGPGIAHTLGEPDMGVISTPNLSMNATYFARVSSSGIGVWNATTRFPVRFILNGCSIYNNYIYCIGLGNWNLTYYAKVSAIGIGNWIETTSIPIRIIQGGCSAYDDYLYCVGSRDNSSAGHQTWYAPISSNGIGNWTASTPYPIPVYGDSYCEIPGSGGGFTGGGGPEN